LKHTYQDYLRHDLEVVHYVVLDGSPELIRKRLAARTGHFMDPSLLPSQLEILEPPEDAIQVDIAGTPREIVTELCKKLGLRRSGDSGPGEWAALDLAVLEETFAVVRLPAELPLPEWAMRGGFCSVTRAPGELSIVCREDAVPAHVATERGWRCLRVE